MLVMAAEEDVSRSRVTERVALSRTLTSTVALLALSDLDCAALQGSLTQRLRAGGLHVQHLASMDPSDGNDELMRRSGVAIADAHREHRIDVLAVGSDEPALSAMAAEASE